MVRLVGIAERYVIVPPTTGTATLVIDDPWCVAACAVLATKLAHLVTAIVSPAVAAAVAG